MKIDTTSLNLKTSRTKSLLFKSQALSIRILIHIDRWVWRMEALLEWWSRLQSGISIARAMLHLPLLYLTRIADCQAQNIIIKTTLFWHRISKSICSDPSPPSIITIPSIIHRNNTWARMQATTISGGQILRPRLMISRPLSMLILCMPLHLPVNFLFSSANRVSSSRWSLCSTHLEKTLILLNLNWHQQTSQSTRDRKYWLSNQEETQRSVLSKNSQLRGSQRSVQQVLAAKLGILLTVCKIKHSWEL